jgi:transposase
MKLHANHRTCPSSRCLICHRVLEGGWTLQQAAEAAGCSVRTAAKWVSRYRDGDQQLLDRSSRPLRSPRRLPQQRVVAIERLRRVRMTAAEIAEVLELPLSARAHSRKATLSPFGLASPFRGPCRARVREDLPRPYGTSRDSR